MKSTSKAKPSSSTETKREPPPVLYLYGISKVPDSTVPRIALEGIDGSSRVETFSCHNYLCWISRVSKAEFADHLTEHMMDLEWLAAASLRHQKIVSNIADKLAILPARFGTVFLSEDSLAAHVKKRKRSIGTAFERVAEADEWGIKVFATASPRTAIVAGATSGSDYLKRKAQLLQPRSGKKLDTEVQEFAAELTKLAVAVSPGGKASAGQPGLLWHGAFLIRKDRRRKLDAILRKYASTWKNVRRIDCSGPWPPYSFVEEHGG
jgi:hypothetical protein